VCVEAGLEDNILWSNDYPHMEGSFPHGLEHMQRHTAGLTETQLRKVLGLNAARFLGLDPAEYQPGRG
jgi:predicted TIM-barrel fold metal-dependent hydrolase